MIKTACIALSKCSTNKRDGNVGSKSWTFFWQPLKSKQTRPRFVVTASQPASQPNLRLTATSNVKLEAYIRKTAAWRERQSRWWAFVLLVRALSVERSFPSSSFLLRPSFLPTCTQTDIQTPPSLPNINSNTLLPTNQGAFCLLLADETLGSWRHKRLPLISCWLWLRR